MTTIRIRAHQSSVTLTELVNQVHIAEAVAAAIAKQPFVGRAAVLTVGVSGFSALADTLGPGHQEVLLNAVQERVQYAAGLGRMVVRIGRGEFAVVLSDAWSTEVAVDLAEAIVREVAACTFRIGWMDLNVAVRVGIATTSAPRENAHFLVRRAHLALRNAMQRDTDVSLSQLGARSNAVAV